MNLLCLDVGSTWTKGALVSLGGGLLGTAAHATTPPEVLHGIDAVTDALAAREAQVLACSSAGGGLRLAVVGQERLISAEAGYRVALSAGAKVVHVAAGQLDSAGIGALLAARPDVLLLVGGTDGGDEKVLLHNAKRLAANRVRVPVVLAGNLKVRDEAHELLRRTGRTVLPTDNVLPDVGELAPNPARRAIREVFLRHVIGGKGLSRGPRFGGLVRMVTPDAVLSGVSRLAGVLAAQEEQAGAVLVVDVGGATTDVYSAVSAMDEEVHAVALPADRRTVEGDIGLRWSAPGVVAEAVAERLIPDDRKLTTEAARLAGNPGIETSEVDIQLAGLAAVLALRRHLRMVDGRLGPRGAGLIVLSGGVFRYASGENLAVVERTLRDDPVLRPVLRTAEFIVDSQYVLAPAGLLADAGHDRAADTLVMALR